MKYYKTDKGYTATVGRLDFPEITKEEFDAGMLNAQKRMEVQSVIQEKSRPLTESEVSRMLITQQINTLTVDDNTALRMKEFYPTWEDCVKLGTVYHDKPGFKFSCGDKLFSCVSANPTFQASWIPGTDTASLYTEVCETHDGTLEDPIPYSGNMILEEGKYYMQDYVIYRCIRNTEIAVYQPLTELVDNYVEVV